MNELIELGHEVIVRPHPQTTKFSPKRVGALIKRHKAHPLFSFEPHVDGQDSLHRSDIMVSDWSGAALEYALALKKPVLFCDVPRKINNPHYKDINLQPLEVSLRDKIGVIWDGTEDLAACLKRCLSVKKTLQGDLINRYVFNVGTSDKVLVAFLMELLEEGAL